MVDSGPTTQVWVETVDNPKEYVSMQDPRKVLHVNVKITMGDLIVRHEGYTAGQETITDTVRRIKKESLEIYTSSYNGCFG